MSGQEALVFFLGGIPGLSPGGARQFAASQPVTSQHDRLLLARTLYQQLGFTSGPGTGVAIALLLPAVQAAREAARRSSSGGELSFTGAQQFLLGQVVTNPTDARLLTALMKPAAAGRWPRLTKADDVTLKRG